MKEIGGYIELGGLINHEYHSKALKFNSSRSALRYFIRKNNINKIYLPIYLCHVVAEAIKLEKCETIFYHIDKNFIPIIDDFDKKAYVYIVNYYGLISNQNLILLRKKYHNIIVDNTHDFFRKPLKNVCTIYNCRKYFGVPDGAYLYSNIESNDDLEEYKVIDKIEHLIGRLEKDASSYYQEFSSNDKKFDDINIYRMSKTSQILMGAIDYQKVYRIRINNFNYLYEKLKCYNKLEIPKNLNFMYPLYVKNAKELREYLISKKIYIPKLWPDIVDEDKLNNIELDYINNIIPLPIDQRYTKEDMDIIIKYLEEKDV